MTQRAHLPRPRRDDSDGPGGPRGDDLPARAGGESLVAARRRPGRATRGRGGPRVAGAGARRPAERGRLHRRWDRGGQPRHQGTLLGPPRRGPAPDPHPGQRCRAPRGHGLRALAGRARGGAGRVAARGRPRPSPPRDVTSSAGRGSRVGGPGIGHVGQQRGRHGAADRRAGGGGSRVRGSHSLRRRAGPRSAAGRLHRERAGRDDRHRSQDRRTARRRGAGPEPRTRAHAGAARRRPGARRPVRNSRHPCHRRLRGGRRGRRQAPARTRRAPRAGCATTWYDGSPPPYPTLSSVATRTCHPRIGSRATRTSPSPAARATPCCFCWTHGASSARPVLRAQQGFRSPATCSSRWASPRTSRAGRCASPSVTRPRRPTSTRLPT